MKITIMRVAIAILFACAIYLAGDVAYFASTHSAALMLASFGIGIIAGILICFETTDVEGENE